MKKLIVAALLSLAPAVTVAAPAAAAPTPTPSAVATSLASSPICIGFGSIGYCIPFT